jgi:hypothetical protein
MPGKRRKEHQQSTLRASKAGAKLLLFFQLSTIFIKKNATQNLTLYISINNIYPNPLYHHLHIGQNQHKFLIIS